MRNRSWLLIGLVTAIAGCQGPRGLEASTDEPSTEPIPTPESRSPGAFLDVRVMGDSSPVRLDDPPTPITGGTLYVTNSGYTAIVADPDRDRVLVVDLVGRNVTGVATLPAHAEPFRAVEDATGRVHVVLRGTGDVLSFAPNAIESATRQHVCAMPRGIAYDAEDDSLVVACRSGELVTLGTDGAVRSTVQVEPDLRDVVISDGRLFVSTFRTAHLLELDRSTGAVLRDSHPETLATFGGLSRDGSANEGFSPSVAWRTSAVPDGAHTIAAVHQRASDTPVEPSPGGYGSSGGGSDCGETGIVQSAITIYSLDGTHTAGTELLGATLPVDIAFARDGSEVTVIAAANESGTQAVQTYALADLRVGSPCGSSSGPVDEAGVPLVITNPIAAAYDGAGRLIVQQREPAQLIVVGLAQPIALATPSSPATSRYDTGHSVFHGNSGAFIACASCHPEGGDDGRVWNFDHIGERRTPALHGELTGTEPFHWDGDMTDLHMLVHQVFTGRMSGPELSGRQIDTLGHWLDNGITAPVHEPGIDVDAVTRGQDLFNGEAGCNTCHSGPYLTNNQTMDVGTGGRFQVPSLIGVSYRLPLMHNGSCPTLRARLTDVTCSGGDHHGHTSQLRAADVDDLIAYLSTL